MKTRVRQIDTKRFLVESFQAGHPDKDLDRRGIDTPPEALSQETQRKWVAENEYFSLEEANEYAARLSAFNKEDVINAFEDGQKI